MAAGSIRIVRDAVPSTGGSIQEPGRETAKGGIRITPEVPGESTSVPGGINGSGNATRRKRATEAKRASLSIEDRDGIPSSEVTPKVQPNRTTPAPTVESKKPRAYTRTPRRYMGVEESRTTAAFLLSAAEMVGVTVAGPIGEMTEFERGMLTPPLQRILQRTPVGIIERATPLIDICFLVMGGAIYFNRVSGGMSFPSKPKSRAVQEDMQAPQSAPVERTVETTRPGDVDGIAVPVPSAITQVMNGAI